MTQEQIDRINELSRKARTPEGLTPEETVERQQLRQAYVAAFRKSLTDQLEAITLVDENGNKRRLRPKS